MIRKDYVSIPGGQIHVRRSGTTGPRVLLLHKTASSGASCERIMTLLAGTHQCLAPDTPGFGGSFDPPGGADLSWYADRLVETARAIGWDGAHVFGHHTGACIAVEMAVGHPDFVRSASLLGVTPLEPDEREQFRAAFSEPFAIQGDGGHLLAAWAYLAKLGAVEDLELRHRELLDLLRATWTRPSIYHAVWDQDFADRLARVRCPVQLLSSPGDVLHHLLPRAQTIVPGARTTIVAGTNYQLDEDAQGLAAALQDVCTG